MSSAQRCAAALVAGWAWLAQAQGPARVPGPPPAGAASQTTADEAPLLREVEVEGRVETDAPREPTRPATRLGADELRERGGGTLGEAIADEPGVTNSTFGPGVGLPVIRGLAGTRVRVLSNGGATHDAATFSPDHATSAEAMLADEVRVLRGPATIRYGGAAIGGAVDVVDNRIPRRLPARPLTGVLQGRHDFNGDVRAGSFRLDVGAAPFALHASGFARRRNNSVIAGCAIDAEAIRAQFGLTNTRNTCGHIDNTGARADAMTVGGALFGEIGSLGLAASKLAHNYGIPPSAGHSHGDGPARIDLANTRYDLRAELWGGGEFIDSVRLEVGSTLYRHHELEGSRIATTFDNRVIEARLEIDHRIGRRVSGTLGWQSVDRVFSALGAEAFIPRTGTDMSAIYLIERAELPGGVRLEAAWRREYQATLADPQRTVDGRLLRFPLRTFRLESHSLAASWNFLPKARVGFVLGRAKRAPEVHELYSFGPHLATSTFDIGSSNLRVEAMRSKDLTLDADIGGVRFNAAVFENAASDFLFQRSVANLFFDTDEARFRVACVRLEDCLPVTRYEQSDARFRGYEVAITARVPAPWPGRTELGLFSDRVRGRLILRHEDVPRLPPPRYGAHVGHTQGPWSLRVRYTRVEPQAYPGVNETRTAGYELLNATLTWRARVAGREAILFARGRNLLDREIRNATSFLRNFSPEAGRSIELGAELRF
jgi:iron complex outermembrane receptor protein